MTQVRTSVSFLIFYQQCINFFILLDLLIVNVVVSKIYIFCFCRSSDIVPLYKQADPFPSLFQCSKSFRLIIRTIFQRFEKTFDIGVVIAYTWSAV